jgi:hypothetical protein
MRRGQWRRRRAESCEGVVLSELGDLAKGSIAHGDRYTLLPVWAPIQLIFSVAFVGGATPDANYNMNLLDVEVSP